MNADNTHTTGLIQRMVEAVHEGADVAIASKVQGRLGGAVTACRGRAPQRLRRSRTSPASECPFHIAGRNVSRLSHWKKLTRPVASVSAYSMAVATPTPAAAYAVARAA